MGAPDRFLIHPTNPLKIAWDGFLSVMVVGVALVVPFQVVLVGIRYDWFYWLVTVLLCADVAVRFNTAFLRLQTLVTDRKEIAKQYLGSLLVLDLLCALPIGPVLVGILGDAAVSDGAQKYMMLLRVLSLTRLRTLLHIIEKALMVNPAIMRMTKFLIRFALAAHAMALGWIVIGAAARIEMDLGIIRDLSHPVPHLDRYVRALYFVITTMATIGYGDITPHKDRVGELIYTIFVQITGVGMYGYIIGNVSSMLANLDVAKANFRRRLEEINAFMRSRKLPPALQAKVRDYFDYMWEVQQSTGEENVLDRLPASISLDIRLFLTGEILQKVPFFKRASEVFIREIVTRLEGHVFLPGDYVMRQGEYGDCMYFVNSGRLEVILDDTKVVATLRAGSHVGEMALIEGCLRSASVRAMEYCEVYRLSKESFDEIRSRHKDFDAQIREEMARRQAANKK